MGVGTGDGGGSGGGERRERGGRVASAAREKLGITIGQ